MPCPLCDDVSYPSEEAGRWLPDWHCSACGYRMNAEERAVWNSAFGAAHVLSHAYQPERRMTDSLVRAGVAVATLHEAHKRDRDEARIPRELEGAFKVCCRLHRTVLASNRQSSVSPLVYGDRHDLLEALGAVANAPRLLRLAMTWFQAIPVKELTPALVEGVELLAFGPAGAVVRQRQEAAAAE